MASLRSARRLRAADYDNRLRVTAVATVISGVVLLALAAFLLSYGSIHQIARDAGVSPALAGLYPLILYTMLVLACVAALALREAAWWMRGYVWLSILVLLATVAFADAMHAADVSLPQRAMAAAIAAIPWALLLLGFGLWLLMLRHLRVFRAGPARNEFRRQRRAAHAMAGGPVLAEDRQASVGFPFWDSEPDNVYAQEEGPYEEAAGPYEEAAGPYAESPSQYAAQRPTPAPEDGPDVRVPEQPFAQNAGEPPDDTPDVRVIPPEPIADSTGTTFDDDTPYVRVIPPQPKADNTATAPDNPDVSVGPAELDAHEAGKVPHNPDAGISPTEAGRAPHNPDAGISPTRPKDQDPGTGTEDTPDVRVIPARPEPEA